MKARQIIELTVKPRGRARGNKVYKVATFHRDHREYDDDTHMIEAEKLAKKLPGSTVVEFGNNLLGRVRRDGV